MREDFYTNDPAGAADWQRHQAPDDDIDADYDEPGLTAGGVDDCGHCGGEFCFTCAFARVFGGGW